MSTLTIRNLDDTLKERLRMTAALHGRSMEEEVRTVLSQAPATGGLGSRVHARFAALGGLELELPQREEPPRPAVFDGSGTSA